MSREPERRDEYLWDPAAPAEAEVERLEALLAPHRHRAPLRATGRPRPARPLMGATATVACAAAIALLVAASQLGGNRAEIGGAPVASRPPAPAAEPGCAQAADAEAPWTLIAAAGTPRCDGRPVAGPARVAVGGWIETDHQTRATLRVGDIGTVAIAPGSRLSLVASRQDEHRLQLERGEIHAKIVAPPRIFFVDTASSTAVDLGCEYTLAVDERGDGVLRVTTGFVSLEAAGRASFVPAGGECQTRAGAGPGTPYRTGAGRALREALTGFDFDRRPGALAQVLAAATSRDTLTLWHLLGRVEGADRQAVFDRLAAISAPPPEARKPEILDGNPAALERWRNDLEESWFAD